MSESIFDLQVSIDWLKEKAAKSKNKMRESKESMSYLTAYGHSVKIDESLDKDILIFMIHELHNLLEREQKMHEGSRNFYTSLIKRFC